MNSTAPRRLLAALRSAHAEGKTFVETTDELSVTCELTLPTARILAETIANPDVAKCGGISVFDALNVKVELSKIALLTGSCRVEVRKPNTNATCYFFQASALQQAFLSNEFSSYVRTVLVAEDFEEFATLSCRFQAWTEPVADVAEPLPLQDVKVRRLVLEGGVRNVPSQVGQLLRIGEAPAWSAVYGAWMRYAISTLPLTLANEVRVTDKVSSVVFSSLRDFEIVVDATMDASRLELELAVARWVFTEGTGFETRWNFITSELGRLWPANTSWSPGFTTTALRALDASQASYRLFLSGTSGDVLKALGDLRKTLNEEVAKVVTQTRDLISSLWRDFAIAATAFAARAAVQATASLAGNSDAVRGLMLGAAIFLTYSVVVTLVSNAWFIRCADSARDQWFSSAYSFVGITTYEELAGVPLRNALRVYHGVSATIGIAYAVTVGFLVAGFLGIPAGGANGISGTSPSAVTAASSLPASARSASPHAKIMTRPPVNGRSAPHASGGAPPPTP